MMIKNRPFTLLLTFVLVISAGAGYASAAAEYYVQAEDTIDIPDQTVSVDGTEYTVSTVGRVHVGETLVADTDGPEGEVFDINFYTSEQRIIDVQNGTSGSVSFQTGYLQPGTYTLVVYPADGSLVAPQPVVVAGYETTLTAPSEMTAGDSSELTVELDDLAGLEEPERVELVIAQKNDIVKTVTMTADSPSEYSTIISSSLKPGEYEVYANVRNESRANGEHEIVGISNRQSISVLEPSESGSVESDPSSSSSDSSDNSANGDDGSGATTESSNTAMPIETANTTTEQTTVMTTEQTTDSQTAGSGTSTAETPSESTRTDDTETSTFMPNFALYIVALALIVAAFIARR